jgi:hypothetical protein
MSKMLKQEQDPQVSTVQFMKCEVPRVAVIVCVCNENLRAIIKTAIKGAPLKLRFF